MLVFALVCCQSPLPWQKRRCNGERNRLHSKNMLVQRHPLKKALPLKERKSRLSRWFRHESNLHDPRPLGGRHHVSHFFIRHLAVSAQV